MEQVSTVVSNVSGVVKGAIGQALKANGLTSEMKMELYAMGANELIMRIENIADTFDTEGGLIYETVNVQGLCESLFMIANDNAPISFVVQIEETSITANQSYQDMASRKLKWKTVDDVIGGISPLADTLDAMLFQQQRIRTFKIKYIVG